MLAFAGLIYNFWHDNQHPNLETSTVLHHAENFIFLNSKAHGTVHFQSRQLFLFNYRRERQLWVASKSFVHLSDSKSLHFLLGLSEMCVPLKEWLKSSPDTQKLEKSRNFALSKECRAREVLQREPEPLGSQRQDLEQIGLGWRN